MPGHADRVIKDELDLIAQERIGDKLGKPAEVRQYRDSCNTGAEVYCNGVVLQARSNYQLKLKILEMDRKGILLKHFKQGFGFDV
jgi:hypothetical protein